MTAVPPFTTEETWSVLDRNGNDIPLQTFGYNIETWGDTRQSAIALRGDDVTVPWIPGEAWVPKVLGPRVITLGMWVVGCNPDGSVPSVGRRRAFDANWAKLRRLLWNRGERISIVKRFYDESYTLREAVGTAEFAGGLEPSMMGRTGAKFTVDLKFADPFFYGSPITLSFDTSSSPVWNGTILGDWYARRVSINATANAVTGCTNPGVTVSTMNPGLQFTIQQVVAASKAIMVDSPTQLATVDGTNVGAQVSHSTWWTDWIELNPGAATVTFSKSAGNWAGNLTYYPAWM